MYLLKFEHSGSPYLQANWHELKTACFSNLVLRWYEITVDSHFTTYPLMKMVLITTLAKVIGELWEQGDNGRTKRDE